MFYEIIYLEHKSLDMIHLMKAKSMPVWRELRLNIVLQQTSPALMITQYRRESASGSKEEVVCIVLRVKFGEK